MLPVPLLRVSSEHHHSLVNCPLRCVLMVFRGKTQISSQQAEAQPFKSRDKRPSTDNAKSSIFGSLYSSIDTCHKHLSISNDRISLLSAHFPSILGTSGPREVPKSRRPLPLNDDANNNQRRNREKEIQTARGSPQPKLQHHRHQEQHQHQTVTAPRLRYPLP